MTNFGGSKPGGLTRERVLFWGPALLGVLLAATAGGLLLLPAWQRLQLLEQQLQDLQQQQQRLPLLRRQLTVAQERHSRAQEQQRRLLALIEGSGELRTFLAQLNLEARASGVQLVGYEPTSGAPAPPASPAAGVKPAPAPPPDPLQAPGLHKTSLLLRVRGHGPQLQDFLRRLERLSLLVVQSDLSLKVTLPESTAGSKPAAAAGQGALLSLTLSLYGP